MKVKTALDSLVQWSVKELGAPGAHTNLPRRLVPFPSAQIPQSITNPKVRQWIASLRYPITSRRDVDINHVWQAYETTVDKFGVAGLDAHTGDIGRYFCDQLQLPGKTSNYLFGPGRDINRVQLEFLAVLVARIAHEIFGCPLIDEPGTYAAKIGAQFSFGIRDGKLVSRFNNSIQVQPARAIMTLDDMNMGRVDVGAPIILNLYKRAEDAGDESIIYFLDCGVWLSQGRATTLHKSLYNYVRLSEKMRAKEEAGLVTPKIVIKDRIKVQKPSKLPFSATLYRQGKYIVDHAEDPRRALLKLLVPHVISHKEFQREFGNPYTKFRQLPKSLDKMRQALDALYGVSLGLPKFEDNSSTTDEILT